MQFKFYVQLGVNLNHDLPRLPSAGKLEARGRLQVVDKDRPGRLARAQQDADRIFDLRNLKSIKLPATNLLFKRPCHHDDEKQWQWGGGVLDLSIEDLSIWEFVCICSSSMQLHCMMQFD